MQKMYVSSEQKMATRLEAESASSLYEYTMPVCLLKESAAFSSLVG